jgi:hypothetical protein
MSADLAVTLVTLDRHLKRYVWFPRPEQATAIVLWIAHTHAMAAVEQSPILAITSPVKQSGKSRLLDVIETVVPTPWRIERPSEAVLFRRIARDHPTVLMDEADTIFNDRKGQYEGLRAIFNAGNRRGTVVSRVLPKGKSFELVDFTIFGPKAVAGIGRFPETLVDRSIVIAMTRRAPGDRVERLRTRRAEELGAPIREALAAGLADVPSLTLPDDDLPYALDDRGQDNWEPLLALARFAGGDWPYLANVAALVLQSDRQTADDNAAVTLLRDLAGIFGDRSFMTTSDLLEKLVALDSSPWSEWSHGKALTARGLARLLDPFGVSPDRSRTVRGYSRHQFADAWGRYLVTDVTDVTDPQGLEGETGSLDPLSTSCRVDSLSRGGNGEEEGTLPFGPPLASPSGLSVTSVTPVTALDFDAPLCDGCGKRKRAVATIPGRYVCTWPHGPVAGAPA